MMGPLISAEHRDRVRGYVDGPRARGRRSWSTGGTALRPRCDGDSDSEGFFLGCTLLDGVAPG
jgi:malonate-semialdehyde dehydrogenase (acetylating)/methylmalonate-semialdehyde dehydrogenase